MATKHLTKNLNRNIDTIHPKKNLNKVFWVLALLLGVLAVTNQQLFIYI